MCQTLRTFSIEIKRRNKEAEREKLEGNIE